MTVIRVYKLESSLDIPNTDISNYPLISNHIVWTYFLLIYVSLGLSQS